MNLIDRVLLEWSYKTKKGYPDINSQEDMALFESIFGFELGESNMGGKATGYPSTTGTFEKYVRDKKDSSTFMYSADKDTILIPTSEDDEQLNIKKGEEFNIISNSELDLIKKGVSKFATVKYGGKEYLINLTAINKPTGKGVEKFAPGDSKKLKTGVLHPFIPGHPQEKDVALLFQNASDENYNFNHNGKDVGIDYIGEARGKTPGKPKTDLLVILDKEVKPVNSNKLRISLKAGNAAFVENWTRPPRALQIFEKTKLKEEVIRIYNGIVANTLLKKGTTTLNLAFFVSTSSSTYTVEGRGPLQLNEEEAFEAYTASKKFGADSELTPNCFFKGSVPNEITELVQQLVPFDKSALSVLQDLYIHVRGSNEARGGSLFIKRETVDSPWYINPDWVTELGISLESEEDGVRKYK
tara:strand:- start:1194 stop:2432 length:1239 start_codon:yes stop_codon:yes gene_type:complete